MHADRNICMNKGHIMLKKLPKEVMGTSNLGWLQSRFHFSFAQYFNKKNMNFGALRVLNDDIVQPQSGFEMHPHDNMEIISYIVSGEITHKDSMQNKETLNKGEVQYLSAGSGIFHSEHNLHESHLLRLLQIWILPPKKNLPKLYGSHKYTSEQRHNKWLNIVSSQEGHANVKIHQDVNIYVSQLDEGKQLYFSIEKERQIYFVQIEGKSRVNKEKLCASDALEIVEEELLEVEAIEPSHVLFIEMKKS